MQNFLPPKLGSKTILLRPDEVECSLPGSYDISLEADCKSASNRSSLFCLRIANPQERLADLRISITPSGLAYLPYA